MDIDFDKRDGHPVWNAKNLLAVLAIVASLTFGMFTWDMERGLNKLDAVDANSSQTAAQVRVLVDQMSREQHQQDFLAGRVDDHEKRITVLETINAGVPPRFRGPR